MENDFIADVSKPILLFFLGLVIGTIKAYIFRTPLSKKGELIKYQKYLIKPVFWTFVAMFSLFIIIGIAVQNSYSDIEKYVEVLQKSLIAGLYASAGVYVFMLWSANLIRRV